MRVVIFLLTLVSQNLVGNSLNSSLGASFALGGNFGEQQTQKSSFIPKISSKYKTSTAIRRICEQSEAINTRICDLDSATRAKNAESTPFCHSERSEEFQNNPSLRADSQDLRGNPQGFARAVARSNHPPIKKMQKSQGGLPRSLALARNDNLLDSSLRLRSAQNDKIEAENDKNSVRVAESSIDSANFSQSGLPRSHSLARNNNLLDSSLRLRSAQNDNFKESAESSKKSPQDAEFAEFATCKDDITGFWLSPLDKVSARTSIIEIFKKDGKYFAYNVAFLDELPPKKDALNQNFALRDREILGSVYAYNLERSGEESYINGRYYDFNRGKIFHLKAKLDCDKLILLISADNVGFLGKKKIYKTLEKSEAEFYIKTRPTIDFSGVK